MPYSRPVMTLIFNKLSFDGADAAGDPVCLAAPKRRHREADMWTDVQRVSFRARPTEATDLANTWVSTPSLCNANFGRS
jgi:hypothetical protein